ncbi:MULTISPECIES: ATP-binding protein [Asticcacaulis]|uniref:ATP-binding protein n=1 Tax=Asticcacaulis TaxID=76890 RepID=UPI001AE548E8|nr:MULTISPECIES: ATP-binding protein [Asticcacaulis]MBP2157469.1 light-regulated signal transduction histidine kinase (bacteriophytochrome) [Asticcacaulis solisilvae]MDR6798514.1 light-regulated signal transduction histidine kinase (bacteriophytochrome) [Asticcacaulis sp. BE141]
MSYELVAPADSLDITACEREPIRIPGSIQPHGLLLVADARSLHLQQASMNAQPVLARPIGECVGNALSDVLLPDLARLIGRFDDPSFREGPVVLGAVALEAGTYNVLAHVSGPSLILEFEQLGIGDAGSLDQVYPQVRAFLNSLQASSSIAELNARAARHVRDITGFDRVMIYQFDDQWNGTVVAENRNEALPSYLDLRFPASDIPAQARELYRLNRLRLIPDATYEPVAIVPEMNPATGAPVDLSLSLLRSVSPVHLEYMRNMGTPSSMSISIIDNGRLWGLISCHHSQPKVVPAHVRTACDFVGQMLAMQLSARFRNEEAVQRVGYQAIQSDLLASMAGEPFFIDGLKKNRDGLLRLTEASGAAIVFGGTVSRIGACPDEKDIQRIVAWLSSKADDAEVYATDCLSDHMEGAESFAEMASGLLAVSISQLHASYILWFRPEVIQTVTWGGDPSEKVRHGSDPQRLHPRKSFEQWKETVRLRSLKWTNVQRDVASAFRSTIVSIVMRKAEELAALNQELTRSNKELEAFSYSVSHDLRAPFRHIVGYAEMLKDKYGDQLDAKATRYINVIVESAGSAGKLVDDLLGFSQMGRMTVVPIRVDMNRLVKEVRDVLDTETNGRDIQWHIGDLHSVHGDPGMMRQVMQNLVSNAIKYTRGRDTAQISIDSEETPTETIISIKDNGVGFDMAYVDKLFGVFQRLHRVEDYEGTGIGLANVRRIMERHGGRAWAEGELNKGAAFHIALPRNQGA